MDSTARDTGAKEISLIESLDLDSWIKLPLAVMRDVGPATQTLGGLLRLANRETFVAVERIAERARVPLKTARNHLDALRNAGWIVNAGRQRTRAGRPRRTCTITIHPNTTAALVSYGILPWWAAGNIRTVNQKRTGRRGTAKMPWCAKAVLSIIMARLASLVKVVNEQTGKADLDTEDMAGSLANLDGSEGWRWRWSVEQLGEQTGLHAESVVQAKRWLAKHGIINWKSTTGRYGGSGRHILEPSDSFRVIETPAGEGKCYLDFRG
jgi:hypothetical protein